MDFLFEEGKYLSFASYGRQAMVPKKMAGDCVHLFWLLEHGELTTDFKDTETFSKIPEEFRSYLFARWSDNDANYRKWISRSAEMGYPVAQFIFASLMIFESNKDTKKINGLFEKAALSGHLKSRFMLVDQMRRSKVEDQRQKAEEWAKQCEVLGLEDALQAKGKPLDPNAVTVSE